MKLTTAGESHGKALVAIIEGLPAHLHINKDQIDGALARRQGGFGRGARQKIEKDRVEILTGVRNNQTLGSPLALCIYNKDFDNWKTSMSAGECEEGAIEKKRLTKVRPGHADLTGIVKFEQTDARNILERASARETAIRVAAGEVYRAYLTELGVEIAGYVTEVCGVKDGKQYAFDEVLNAKHTELGMLDKELETLAKEKITALKAEGDTAGGVVEIRVKGLQCGFGSMMTYGEKLDARLAQGLMSIQAVKGVEFGLGFGFGNARGSEANDPFDSIQGRVVTRTNNNGGINGGISNGMPIICRLAVKPTPSIFKEQQTLNIETDTVEPFSIQGRHDPAIVHRAVPVAEAVAALVVSDLLAQHFGKGWLVSEEG